MELIGGSCIVSPLGEVIARAATVGEELIEARIDLEQITAARERWNFFSRRHPEQYRLITEPVREEYRDTRLIKSTR